MITIEEEIDIGLSSGISPRSHESILKDLKEKFFNTYNSGNDTEYLMSSNKNKEHLLNSINDLRNGNFFEKELVKE